MQNNNTNNLTDHPFTTAILTWYAQNKRHLPWRQGRDPYLIWLSEIILQQTRVAQGLPYYQRFVQAFPDVFGLAGAEEEEVLRLWQGLGYYTRARNLHQCARIIVDEYQGLFPETMAALLTLPGIGRYTAAAIASLAFNEPVPVVDGNTYRLLARYFGDETDISSSAAFNHFYQLSQSLLDSQNPGDYNQAVMEFGALYCVPRQPDCGQCVLQQGCVARARGRQALLPVKKRKTKTRTRNLFYLLVVSGDKLLMRQRPPGDIWQGLYEPVLIEHGSTTTLASLQHPVLTTINNLGLPVVRDEKNIRHQLSHQRLNVNFAIVNLNGRQQHARQLVTDEYDWYDLTSVEALPKPVLIANYLDTHLNSINLQ